MEPVEQMDNNSMSGDLMEASPRSDDEETGQINPNAPMSESAASHHKMVKIINIKGIKQYDISRLSHFIQLIALLSLIFIIQWRHERTIDELIQHKLKKIKL